MSDLIDRKIAVQGVKELFSMGDCYCDELSIVGIYCFDVNQRWVRYV